MAYLSFLLFPLVGALIGAVTNHLAIRMLFRPFNAVWIGKFQLPFTPGVIPRKRAELAANIARTFEEHLLSGGTIRDLLAGTEMTEKLENKIDEFIASLGVMGGMVKGMKPKIVEKLLESLSQISEKATAPGGSLDIGQLIERRINEMDLSRLEKLILDVTSSQLRHITIFGGLLGALIGLIQALLNLAL